MLYALTLLSGLALPRKSSPKNNVPQTNHHREAVPFVFAGPPRNREPKMCTSDRSSGHRVAVHSTYRRQKQHRMSNLPRNQRPSMNRRIDRPEVVKTALNRLAGQSAALLVCCSRRKVLVVTLWPSNSGSRRIGDGIRSGSGWIGRVLHESGTRIAISSVAPNGMGVSTGMLMLTPGTSPERGATRS